MKNKAVLLPFWKRHALYRLLPEKGERLFANSGPKVVKISLVIVLGSNLQISNANFKFNNEMDIASKDLDADKHFLKNVYEGWMQNIGHWI